MTIVVADARKSFRPRRGAAVTALDGVSLEVEHGELVVIVGPSGSGKSTLLRAIAGLERLDNGDITIAGRNVTNLPPGPRNVALVFQDYALFPHLSVAANIGFGERARGTSRAETQRKVDEAAAALGLVELLERLPSELSGGERQRVALARALVREATAFLLDEPLANLDAELRLQMRAELRALRQRLDVPTLYVTHDQHEALALADRIVVIRAGRVEQTATPAEIYARPATGYVARLFGPLPMNLLPAELIGGGTAPIFGVRPERVRLVRDGARLTGQVRTVEPGGEDAVIHVACGLERVLVRVRSSTAPRVGEEAGLSWNDADAHWFASHDGMRLA